MEAQAAQAADSVPLPEEPAAPPELSRTETGLRVLYSIVFTAILHVVIAIFSVLIVFQIVYALVTRERPHARVGALGSALTRYCTSVFAYLTFNAEKPPFPFDDLPD